MKYLFLPVALASLLLGTSICRGQSGASLDLWKSGTPPFSLIYNGKPSADFLPSWQKTQSPVTPSEGGETHHFIYSDPSTKLTISVDVRTYTDFPAVDWVLHFTNNGAADSPILENIQPLDWPFPAPSGRILVSHARGSNANVHDFEPIEKAVGPGQTYSIGSRDGRSSDTNTLPFFNLQSGAQGLIGAIGWTGDWAASFHNDKTAKTLSLTAGMQATHFLLHPGETVRTPRIVLLNWHGDIIDAQNLWRRLMVAHYSPKDPQGKNIKLPICLGTWGTELISAKLELIKKFRDFHIPVDVYWVDAGWYGNESPKPGKTVDNNVLWYRNRGSWWPNKISYPDGLKPLGDAVHAANMRFLLWIEPEEADPDTTLRADHPDWFFMPPNCNNPGTALVNMGDPAVRKGITDLVSKIISGTGIDWYRQDFNVAPNRSWHAADSPDRVGISEIKYITGLYQFWDDLRTLHPSLQIDNCASGGRRLDVETASRSVPLWRSDYECNPFDPAGGQAETAGLAPWLPLNAGCMGGVVNGTPDEGPGLIYALRSSYSSAFDFNATFPFETMKPLCDEFHEIRPYFLGDFYPLTHYKPAADLTATVAWQFDRPGQKSGLVVVLRRQQAPGSTTPLELRAIDPSARYNVEIRTGWEKAPIKSMSGKDLAQLHVDIPDKPGSALVFYNQR